MKKIVLLGSTGSIGRSTIKVVQDLKENFEIIGLGAGRNVKLLAEQIELLKPRMVSVADTNLAEELKTQINNKVEIGVGDEGLVNLALMPEADIVLIAIVGTAGLRPALAAIRAGKDIAVASKEILVMAGEIVMAEARKYGVHVLTVDSEHSAIFQCLEGRDPKTVRRLILTASGGPFRNLSASEFPNVTLSQALNHPSWKMGKKITLDSATLFNKALEMIEARWLFNVEIDRVSVVVHPQSIVHSMVEFIDGSILAQMSTPDMCLPIQYALTWPTRMESQRVKTDFPTIGSISFENPDTVRFPALRLAREAGSGGGVLPAVLNAANEIAAEAFFNGSIRFDQIPVLVEKVLTDCKNIQHPDLEQILGSDHWARTHATSLLPSLNFAK